MSMKRSPEWLQAHEARMDRHRRFAREWNGNIELVELTSGEPVPVLADRNQPGSSLTHQRATQNSTQGPGMGQPARVNPAASLTINEDARTRKDRGRLVTPVTSSPAMPTEGGVVNQPTHRGPSFPASSSSSAAPIYPIVGLCRAAGLPEPVPEYTFAKPRRWRFDYAWPLHRLALEIDGGVWTQGRHTRGAGKIADMEKLSEAAILGWRVLYAVPDDLRNGVAMSRVIRALDVKAAA